MATATDSELRSLLLSERSERWALSPDSTFENLQPEPTNEPLSKNAVGHFESHLSYRVPSGTSEQADHTLHCFALHGSIATAMNVGLSDWAIERVHNWLNDEATGVNLSNEGGYQSHADVFRREMSECELPAEQSASEQEGRRCSGILRSALNAALDECMLRGESDAPGLPDMGVAEEDAEEEPFGGMHSACAWFNASRPGDCNVMHCHPAGRWSGVYYVAGGSALAAADEAADAAGDAAGDAREHAAQGAAEAEEEEHAGHLLFRTGQRRTTPRASHSFLAVPPTAGCLWLFPGEIAC